MNSSNSSLNSTNSTLNLTDANTPLSYQQLATPTTPPPEAQPWNYMLILYVGLPALFMILAIIACVLYGKSKKINKVAEVYQIDADLSTKRKDAQ